MYKELLEIYRNLWNHRILSLDNQSEEVVLKKTIKRELLDELAHPRVRSSLSKKYELAIKRILYANAISDSQKLLLMKTFTEQLDELQS